MARELDGMVAVVTGASAGIGAAVARRLAAGGARLALAARRADRLDALNAELGGGHLVVPTDVSNPDDCGKLIAAAAERFGRIDTLICNAGYGLAKAIGDTDGGAMRAIFATNVFGTTDCIHAALPVMLRQAPRDGWRGQVVIVSSAAARRGLPHFGAYSATKAAQLSIAEAMRVELKSERIAVTSVHPIGTDSDFFRSAETVSGRKIPDQSAIEVHQSPDTVAKAIVRGIRRPRPEVWPFPLTRYALGFAVIAPRLVDWVLGRRQ